MAADKIEHFNEKGEQLFRPLLENYGYHLEEKKINEINGQKWSVHHIYLNNKSGLKIVIEQAPYYTDYGFSLFIYKTATDAYKLLYHVPHEQQDKDDLFLDKACNEIFSNPELADIISDKTAF